MNQLTDSEAENRPRFINRRLSYCTSTDAYLIRGTNCSTKFTKRGALKLLNTFRVRLSKSKTVKLGVKLLNFLRVEMKVMLLHKKRNVLISPRTFFELLSMHSSELHVRYPKNTWEHSQGLLPKIFNTKMIIVFINFHNSHCSFPKKM